VAVVQLDPKVTAFRDQDDFAVEMNELFFAHGILLGPLCWSRLRWPGQPPSGPLVSTIQAPGEALPAGIPSGQAVAVPHPTIDRLRSVTGARA
jgi:hypothetical protein